MWDFVNRERELAELSRLAQHGAFIVVYGRRRVGKTRLLAKWLEHRPGLYSQAVEGSPLQQITQARDDLGLTPELAPKTWAEFWELVSLDRSRRAIVLDEFPYLAAADPHLPSVMQRWIDHRKPRGLTLIVAGSSIRMMNDLFLNRAAPLYGRATKTLKIAPMGYEAFCFATGKDRAKLDTFCAFALVGGVPHYWQHVGRRMPAAAVADELYFGFAPAMEDEPSRLLRDEKLGGATPLAVLEAVGRGARRPSEIAARLQTEQANITRLLIALQDADLLQKELPFGESARSTKRVLYGILDPALRFWFSVFSPHRSRWTNYDRAQRTKLVIDHASTVFEDEVRAHLGGIRYWEPHVEFDSISTDPDSEGGVLVTEVKFRSLPRLERQQIEADLVRRWSASTIARRYPKARFQVIGAEWLQQVSEPG